jgi:hypothetical protein
MLVDGPSARQKAPVRALQGLGLAFGRGRRATSQAARLLPLLCGTSMFERWLFRWLGCCWLMARLLARSRLLACSLAGRLAGGLQWSAVEPEP